MSWGGFTWPPHRRLHARATWTLPANCILWLSAAQSGAVGATGTWTDYSGQSNDHTLAGNAYVDSDGLQLDGSGDYAWLNAHPGFAHTDYQTLCAWIKLGNTGQECAIIGNHRGSFGWEAYGRGLRYNAGTLSAHGEDNNDKSELSGSISDTNWHHIAAVYAASGALYIDGSPVDTGDISSGYSYCWGIGAALKQIPVEVLKEMTGTVDEIMAFNRALDAAEVAGIYGNQYAKA